jgi:hypothetical protein
MLARSVLQIVLHFAQQQLSLILAFVNTKYPHKVELLNSQEML